MSTKYVPPVTTTFAVVHVTLEVVAGSNWGGDCPLDQVYKQAIEDAENILRRALNEQAQGSVRLVGIQDVKIVTTAKKP